MEQKNLFLLLKSALWNDELSARSVHDVDWGELYGLAKEQCLIGIVADSFQYLSIEQCNRNERLRWLVYVVSLERKNQEMNLLITRLFKKFHQMNHSPVLLKGQTFAANYPYPLSLGITFIRTRGCNCPLSLRTAKFLGWRIMRSMPVFVGWNRLGR